MIARVAEAEEVPKTPLIVAVIFAGTAAVLTVNDAVKAPLGTLTDSETEAEVFDAVSVTTLPPVPALAESVTVPVALAPPTTEAGVIVTFFKVCANPVRGMARHMLNTSRVRNLLHV